MEKTLKELYNRLAIVNKMAKEQSDEFLVYHEFYSIQFMMKQAALVKERLREILTQIEFNLTSQPPQDER